MRVINGTFYVADCEHNGDIERVKSYLRSNSCEVISSYWDGHDCGEAYVEFTCKEADFPSLYKRFGISASFDADINNYIQLDGLVADYKRVGKSELYAKLREMNNDLSYGFWDRLPLHLWFEVKERQGLTTQDIVEKCLSFINKADYEVVCYSLKIVDGGEFIDMLIKTSYKNLDDKTIGKYGIGDFALGHDGWLDSKRIYGQCACGHTFCHKGKFGYSYDLLQKVMGMIENGQPLMYCNTNPYSKNDIMVDEKDYIKDGQFQRTIKVKGLTYSLKDARKWVKNN